MAEQIIQHYPAKHASLSALFETCAKLRGEIAPPVFHALLGALQTEVEKKSLDISRFSLSDMDSILLEMRKLLDGYLAVRIQIDVHIHQYQTTRLKHLDYHRLTQTHQELDQLMYHLQKLTVKLHIPIALVAQDELYLKKLNLDAIVRVYEDNIQTRRLHQQREKTLA